MSKSGYSDPTLQKIERNDKVELIVTPTRSCIISLNTCKSNLFDSVWKAISKWQKQLFCFFWFFLFNYNFAKTRSLSWFHFDNFLHGSFTSYSIRAKEILQIVKRFSSAEFRKFSLIEVGRWFLQKIVYIFCIYILFRQENSGHVYIIEKCFWSIEL